ncbi:hypothetical protein EGI94_03770 [Stutzerimonas stutzeri]|uniref:hypothetical protein n=1 Tax=Stutzerimonas stutzeri TaxID=316 RepID=UPI000F76C7A4|nr:hypothetical protein [Stutzerimonas stutzeri]RRV36250.1 hypothetical protein EGI94_03770 [Stutzerimonas stutzeri]
MGTLLIGLILLFSIVQQLDAWREERMQASIVAMREANDLELLASQRQWLERAESAANAHSQLGKRLWVVPSDGAAQAAVRDLLQAEALAAGLPVQRVTVRSVAAGRDQSFAAVRAEVQGDYEPLAWQQFVFALERHEPSVIIESDRIDRSNAQRERYRLNVTAWYRLGPPEET